MATKDKMRIFSKGMKQLRRGMRLGIAMGASIAALTAADVQAAAKYTLNLSTVLTTKDPIYKGFEQFKKAVESRTDGNVVVRLYPSGQLGADSELIQQAQVGGNVAVITDGGRLSQFVPEIAILNAPFVFPDYESVIRFVETPAFKSWEEKLGEKAGVVSLSFNWFQGSRMMITQKPIEKPDDLKGIRVRVIDSPINIESIRCVGGTPTPMAWSEVYSALQTGVIDAAEAHPTALHGAKLYEVAKYVTKTNQYHLVTSLIVGGKWFNQLPDDYKKILHEEAYKAGQSASQAIIALSDDMLAEMQKKGVVVSSVELAPFVEACKGVTAQLGLEEARRKTIEQ